MESPQHKWLMASVQRWTIALILIVWLTITLLVVFIVNELMGSTPKQNATAPQLFITLAWDLPADPIRKTVLYMGTASGSYQARIELGGGPTQTTQRVLINHPQTFFVVTVKDIWGAESGFSNEVEWDQ